MLKIFLNYFGRHFTYSTKVLQVIGREYSFSVSNTMLEVNTSGKYPIRIGPAQTFIVDRKNRRVEIRVFDTALVGNIIYFLQQTLPVSPYTGKGLFLLRQRFQRKRSNKERRR